MVQEDDEIEVVVLEADELWSYVRAKTNPQWLWLIMHSRTRQVVAMEVGLRDKKTAERLFFKLPESLKKKPSTILTSSLCILTLSRTNNIATFRWSRGTSEIELWHSFLEGYQSIRKLSDSEIQAIDVFVKIRNLWWMGMRVTLSESKHKLNSKFWECAFSRF